MRSELAKLAEALGRKKQATAYGTYEQVPGRGVGHLEELIDAPFEQRRLFTIDPRSSWNVDGQDALYAAMGYDTMPSQGMIGAFTPQAGGLEINPGMAAPFQLPATEADRARALDRMSRAESVRAYIDAQNAGAGHLVTPLAATPASERTSLIIDMPSSPSRGEMTGLDDLAKTYGFFPVDTGAGMSFINNPFSPQGEARTATSAGQAAKDIARQGTMLSQGAITPARLDSVFEEYEPLWREPGTGAATRKFLNDVLADEEIAAALEPTLMQKAEANFLRDMESQRTTGYAVREDIQRARQILASSGLKGLKQALESGAVLPAAAAAILLQNRDD